MCPSRSMLCSMVLGLAFTAVSGQARDAYRSFESGSLNTGREIWLETCEGCHGYGIAGAPIPMEYAQWRTRLEKDQPTLYEHALEGFFGEGGTMMPPKGGNDALTDKEVMLAVDYMVALARSYAPNAAQ